MIIHSFNHDLTCWVCDNCRKTLSKEQVRILTNDARLNRYDVDQILHYCSFCQKEADLNFKKYHDIENSDGYGM